MLKRIFTSRLYYQVCIFVLFFIAASASFSGFYQKSHFHEADVAGTDLRTGFIAMVEGTAYRPYVYRQLLPTLANMVDHMVPQTAQERLRRWLFGIGDEDPHTELLAITSSPTARNPVYFFRYLVEYCASFFFALLSVYAMYFLCTALQLPRFAAVVAPVIVILLLPYFMRSWGFGHDYAELAFFALAALVAIRFSWFWIIPLAALGTWNKESFLFMLITLYPFLRLRNSRVHSLIAVAVLCLVSGSIYLNLRAHFAQNPGHTVEPQLQLHIERILAEPGHMLLGTDENFGVRAPRAYSLLPLILLVWTVVRGWKDLPGFMRHHAQIAAAINLPLYFLFCQPGEFRDLSMLYLTLLALLAWNITEFVQSTTPASRDSAAVL